MADMGLETSGFEESLNNLRSMNGNIVAAVDGGTEEYAEMLLEEIKRTAPVNTGRYKNDWRIEKHGDWIFIVNDVPYGPHLVFPNPQFVGAESADVPSVGILHNVRGIVHSNKSEAEGGIIAKIKRLLS